MLKRLFSGWYPVLPLKMHPIMNRTQEWYNDIPVFSMQIEEGQIFASIDQKDGMVSFNDDPEDYGNNDMLNQIDKQIKKTIELAHKLRNADRDIASSTPYIQKVFTNKLKHKK